MILTEATEARYTFGSVFRLGDPPKIPGKQYGYPA